MLIFVEKDDRIKIAKTLSLLASTEVVILMNIELPRKFRKDYSNGKYVVVQKGRLEIHKGCNFERLMVELTFLIRGRDRCYYCGKGLKNSRVTIDHRHPRDFGGVTITNNLVPACGDCNSKKSNLNEYEFAIFRTLEPAERKKYFEKAIQIKDRKRYSRKAKKDFDLPESWIKLYSTQSIKECGRIDNSGGRKYARTLEFATKYGKLPRPIVITSNNILLDGRTAFHVARKLKFKKVPVIQLENVTYYDH